MKINEFALKAITNNKDCSYELVYYNMDNRDNEEYYIMSFNHNNTKLYMDFEIYEEEVFELSMLQELTDSTIEIYEYMATSKDTNKKINYLISIAYKYYTMLHDQEACVIVDTIKDQLRIYATKLIQESPRDFAKVYTDFTNKEKLENYFKMLCDKR